MSRHVVLLRRDPSLGLALRALLHGTGRVTELPTLQSWSTLPVEPIDAVVIDIPARRRKKAIELVRSRFTGRLVVVLDPTDDPGTVPGHHACSVVQRPFEIVELWHLVTTDPAVPSQTGVEPVEESAGERPSAVGRDPASPEASRTVGGSMGPAAGAPTRPGPAGPRPSTPAETAPTGRAPEPPRPGAGDASTWKWRGQRYGPATAIPIGGEQPPGATGAASTGIPPAPPGSPDQPPAAPAEQSASGQPTQPPPSGRRWGALPRRSAPETPGSDPAPRSAPGTPDSGPGAPSPAAPASSPAAGSPPSGPTRSAAETASSGAGSESPATPTASPPAGSDRERSSLLRRLGGRLGGRRSASEVEAPPPPPTEVRSPSNPAFEPAPVPPEAAQQPPPDIPAWPTSSAQARSAP
jgi:hypothetical protein